MKSKPVPSEPVTAVRTHLRLPFRLSAGALAGRFFDAVRRGEIHGNRCVACSRVFVPPRSFCPRCWERCEGWIRVADTGTVTTFVVVNVPFYGQEIEIPYVLAHVLLDGADCTIQHLVGAVSPEGKLVAPAGVRMGMRVRAVWRDPPERSGLLNDDVDHFTPTGEPDRDVAGPTDSL